MIPFKPLSEYIDGDIIVFFLTSVSLLKEACGNIQQNEFSNSVFINAPSKHLSISNRDFSYTVNFDLI